MGAHGAIFIILEHEHDKKSPYPGGSWLHLVLPWKMHESITPPSCYE